MDFVSSAFPDFSKSGIETLSGTVKVSGKAKFSGVVALSPHSIDVFSDKTQKIAKSVHLLTIKTVEIPDSSTLVVTSDSQIYISSPNIIQFCHNLYLFYSLSTFSVPEPQKARFISFEPFPQLSVPLSISQIFQFSFFSISSLFYSSFYQHFYPQYLQYMMESRSPVFDFGVLPSSALTFGKAAIVALSSLPVVRGVIANHLSIPQLFEAASDLISNSSSLRFLCLSGSTDTSGFPHFLKSLPLASSLCYLDISDNFGCDFSSLPRALSQMKCPLVNLKISIGGDDDSICERTLNSIATNKAFFGMKVLGIYFSAYSEKMLAAFNDLISNLPELYRLELSTPELLQSLQGKLLKIGSLKLANCKICSFYEVFRSLYELEMSNVSIAPNLLTKILAEYHGDSIKFNEVCLSGENFLPLIQAFLQTNLNQWKRISINSSKLSPEEFKTLVTLFSQMRNLRILEADFIVENNPALYVDGISAIFQLECLNSLSLRGNKLSQIESDILPLFLSNTSIQKVNFSGNNFSEDFLSRAIGKKALKRFSADSCSLAFLRSFSQTVVDSQLTSLPFSSLDHFFVQRDEENELSKLFLKMKEAVDQRRADEGKLTEAGFGRKKEILPSLYESIDDICRLLEHTEVGSHFSIGERFGFLYPSHDNPQKSDACRESNEYFGENAKILTWKTVAPSQAIAISKRSKQFIRSSANPISLSEFLTPPEVSVRQDLKAVERTSSDVDSVDGELNTKQIPELSEEAFLQKISTKKDPSFENDEVKRPNPRIIPLNLATNERESKVFSIEDSGDEEPKPISSPKPIGCTNRGRVEPQPARKIRTFLFEKPQNIRRESRDTIGFLKAPASLLGGPGD